MKTIFPPKTYHSIRLWQWIGVFLTMILSGCVPTTLIVPGKPATHLSHYALHAHLTAIEGHRGTQMNVYWQQDGPNYRIRLSGPLGVGVGEITGNARRATLRTANGQVSTARYPETLAYQETGLLLPIRALHNWIRGLPIPYEPLQQIIFLPNGAPHAFTQNGWCISYQNYTNVNGLRLPTELQLDKPPIYAHIMIDTWIIP